MLLRQRAIVLSLRVVSNAIATMENHLIRWKLKKKFSLEVYRNPSKCGTRVAILEYCYNWKPIQSCFEQILFFRENPVFYIKSCFFDFGKFLRLQMIVPDFEINLFGIYGNFESDRTHSKIIKHYLQCMKSDQKISFQSSNQWSALSFALVRPSVSARKALQKVGHIMFSNVKFPGESNFFVLIKIRPSGTKIFS